MPRSRLTRPFAVVLGTALCGALLAMPAFADSPVAVTFQPGSHWAQEVNTVSRYDSSHDYSVAVDADKTLQINLITRDPNVFFQIKDETSRKQLVDTYQTGATTWSTTTTGPTTYSVHVYVQPEAMQDNETAKYALQIGQYGQSDMQVPATPVTFTANDPWVQESGTLDSQGSTRDYTADIAAGQTLAVNLVTDNPKVHFRVSANGQKLVDNADSNATKWSTQVATAATYTVSVYADPTALPPDSRAGYTVQIGHYVQSDSQAAPAGSTAAPASAGSAGN